MSFIRYSSYLTAEAELCLRIINEPDYRTSTTYERFNEGFILTHPQMNKNARSNYSYAEEFFQWMLTGETELSEKLIAINPWVKRFVDNTGLPAGFSSSYGWKIKQQLDVVLEELENHKETRRAYINILYPADHVITGIKTTMEYPCTIGMQFFIRDMKLILMVNMRSNNCLSVMPYDVYNFTRLQQHIAHKLGYPCGEYIHQINNAHLYKGDVRRIIKQF
jgi:thymidylate synthase